MGGIFDYRSVERSRQKDSISRVVVVVEVDGDVTVRAKKIF